MGKHIPESVELTNMCVIEDGKGNVLVLDKVTGSYRGTTFPGGHIERREIFQDSIIREVKEETGLTIHHPELKGVYHWYRGEVHNLLFVYKAKDYEGELVSSNEGEVYWISLEELRNRKLATGSEHVITMVERTEATECFMREIEGTYLGELY